MRHDFVLMRTLIAALFLGLSSISSAMALSGATADSGDRFPFVVEVKYQENLICSGTVLFPRIVVTSAHCVQQKVYFRCGEFYADSYLPPADLIVTVTHHGITENHVVADVAASPAWLGLETNAGGERFAHDLALIVTKEPIDVGLPPSIDKLADDETLGPKIVSARPTDAAVLPKYEALRGVLETGLTHRGVLVAFGADRCSSLHPPLSVDLDQGERGLFQRFAWPPALSPASAGVRRGIAGCRVVHGIVRHAGRQRRRASRRRRARAALLSRRHLRAAGTVSGTCRERIGAAERGDSPLPESRLHCR